MEILSSTSLCLLRIFHMHNMHNFLFCSQSRYTCLCLHTIIFVCIKSLYGCEQIKIIKIKDHRQKQNIIMFFLFFFFMQFLRNNFHYTQNFHTLCNNFHTQKLSENEIWLMYLLGKIKFLYYFLLHFSLYTNFELKSYFIFLFINTLVQLKI